MSQLVASEHMACMHECMGWSGAVSVICHHAHRSCIQNFGPHIPHHPFLHDITSIISKMYSYQPLMKGGSSFFVRRRLQQVRSSDHQVMIAIVPCAVLVFKAASSFFVIIATNNLANSNIQLTLCWFIG